MLAPNPGPAAAMRGPGRSGPLVGLRQDAGRRQRGRQRDLDALAVGVADVEAARDVTAALVELAVDIAAAGERGNGVRQPGDADEDEHIWPETANGSKHRVVNLSGGQPIWSPSRRASVYAE